MPKKDITRRGFLATGTAALGAATLAAGCGQGQQRSKPMKVRFGLNLLLYTAAFSKEQLGLVQKVADMGYDGVEIPFNDLSVLDPPATRRALEQAKMATTICSVMMPGTSPIGQKPEERQVGVERLKKMIDLAAEMGAEAVAGPLYAPVGELTGRARTPDEWKWGVEALRTAAEHAKQAKIFLAIEPLNRFETYFVNTSADGLAFVKEVNHPNLKLQIDTFHANIEDKDTGASIRAAGPHLGHFHACENDRGTPGTGQVRWNDVFAALREVNYSGWITIESFATGILDLCAAACIWRPIYDSPDNLAKQGLAFLKRQAGVA